MKPVTTVNVTVFDDDKRSVVLSPDLIRRSLVWIMRVTVAPRRWYPAACWVSLLIGRCVAADLRLLTLPAVGFSRTCTTVPVRRESLPRELLLPVLRLRPLPPWYSSDVVDDCLWLLLVELGIFSDSFDSPSRSCSVPVEAVSAWPFSIWFSDAALLCSIVIAAKLSTGKWSRSCIPRFCRPVLHLWTTCTS